MKIKIKDREVELKYTIRSICNYETIMKKQFNPETTIEVLVFFLCVLLASDKQLHLTLDELIDICDNDDPLLLNKFATWLSEEIAQQTMLYEEPETDAVVEDTKKA